MTFIDFAKEFIIGGKPFEVSIDWSITKVSFFLLSILAIIVVGYMLGRVTIKGVNLGTAGVFLIALIYGCFFFNNPFETIGFLDRFDGTWIAEHWPTLTGALGNATSSGLSVIKDIGLILFVTSVGFIAGPKFFGNLKKNFKTYILLGLIIIISGALVCAGCILLGRVILKDTPPENLTALMVGVLSGALTSTPALSAAEGSYADADLAGMVSTGSAIAYIFGVIGVVLFVQLIPKFMKADMAVERAKIAGGSSDTGEDPTESTSKKKLFDIDPFGICVFALAAIVGLLVGKISLMGVLDLSITGGCLIVALIFGHFGHIGKINIMPPAQTLKVFREFGLVLFLIGSGINGGVKFLAEFNWIYLLFGVIITLVPMIIGFIFAKFVLKMNLLNTLGSITGGMTSTPALGTLIQVSGTEDVGSAYAATYPIALIAVVFAAKILIAIF